MSSPLPALIGLRYAMARGVSSGQRRGFLSFIAVVAVFGLALGTAVLILVLSVINGFERELRERVLGILPHLIVDGERPFSDWQTLATRLQTRIPEVRAIAPLITGPVLLATPSAVRAANLSGISPEHESQVSRMPEWVTGSELGALRPGEFSMILGRRLADELKIKLNDSVSVVLPDAAVTPLGVYPRQKRFRVVGLLDSGSELDALSAYVHLNDAQRLYRLGPRTSSLRIKLEDLFAAQRVAERVENVARPLLVSSRDWSRTHGNLYRAILLQKTTMLVLLSLVVAIAAFNLISSLVMVVAEKEGEIAILRSLGMSRRGVMASFLVFGAIIGSLGVGLGVLLGCLGAIYAPGVFQWAQTQWQLDLLTQYFIHYLPSELRLFDVLTVAFIGLLLTFIAAWYPAYRAARLLPADVLRYE